eukprot:745925-Hanusia_phi.AAC.4
MELSARRATKTCRMTRRVQQEESCREECACRTRETMRKEEGGRGRSIAVGRWGEKAAEGGTSAFGAPGDTDYPCCLKPSVEERGWGHTRTQLNSSAAQPLSRDGDGVPGPGLGH